MLSAEGYYTIEKVFKEKERPLVSLPREYKYRMHLCLSEIVVNGKKWVLFAEVHDSLPNISY